MTWKPFHRPSTSQFSAMAYGWKVMGCMRPTGPWKVSEGPMEHQTCPLPLLAPPLSWQEDWAVQTEGAVMPQLLTRDFPCTSRIRTVLAWCSMPTTSVSFSELLMSCRAKATSLWGRQSSVIVELQSWGMFWQLNFGWKRRLAHMLFVLGGLIWEDPDFFLKCLMSKQVLCHAFPMFLLSKAVFFFVCPSFCHCKLCKRSKNCFTSCNDFKARVCQAVPGFKQSPALPRTQSNTSFGKWDHSQMSSVSLVSSWLFLLEDQNFHQIAGLLFWAPEQLWFPNGKSLHGLPRCMMCFAGLNVHGAIFLGDPKGCSKWWIWKSWWLWHVLMTLNMIYSRWRIKTLIGRSVQFWMSPEADWSLMSGWSWIPSLRKLRWLVQRSHVFVLMPRHGGLLEHQRSCSNWLVKSRKNGLLGTDVKAISFFNHTPERMAPRGFRATPCF